MHNKQLEIRREEFNNLKERCFAIFDYMLSVDVGYSQMVDFCIQTISNLERKPSLSKLKAIYKEIIVIIRDTMPSSMITDLDQMLTVKCGQGILGEINKELMMIERILKRGRIINNKEFEIVKRHEEEIYDDDSQKEYAESLRKLMAEYE